jgi:hypothetical protein
MMPVLAIVNGLETASNILLWYTETSTKYLAIYRLQVPGVLSTFRLHAQSIGERQAQFAIAC